MLRPRSLQILAVALALGAADADLAWAWQKNPALNDLLLARTPDLGATRVVDDGTGGVFAVGRDIDPVSNQRVLVASRLDADGQPVFGPEGLPFADIPSTIGSWLAAVPDDAGGFYCAIPTRRSNETRTRIRLYRVNGQGQLMSDVEGVTVATSNSYQPGSEQLVADGQGGVIVVWTETFLSFDDTNIHAQRFGPDLTPVWQSAVIVTAAPDLQRLPAAIPTGDGGVVIAWSDRRSGTESQIYADRLAPDGTSTWVSGGKRICNTGGAFKDQIRGVPDGLGGFLIGYRTLAFDGGDPEVARVASDGRVLYRARATEGDGILMADFAVAPDGSGGAYVGWTSSLPGGAPIEARVQAFTPGGLPRWGTSGLVPIPSTARQDEIVVAADGRGGVVVGVADERFDGDVYAQRLSFDGVPLWAFMGLAVSTAGRAQSRPEVIVRADGSCLFSWDESRESVEVEEERYVQRVDAFGFTGDPRPEITGVADFPQDQGGVAIVEWRASDRDEPLQRVVYDYLVLRRLQDGAAPLARETADRTASLEAAGIDPHTAATLAIGGWEYLTNVPALQLPAYALSVPTYGDLTASSAPVTEFAVMARAFGATFLSDPVGGISTDDLAPGAPHQLVVRREGDEAVLTWSPPLDPVPDLSGYRVYRSHTPDFALDASTLLVGSTQTTVVDPSPGLATSFYRVTAVDVHDNEGQPTEAFTLSGATAVDGPVAHTHRLHGNVPNPFNPRTEITFELARAVDVRLEVFDARGRRVASLVEGTLGAGLHRVSWDGRDAFGATMASGVYFARLDTGDGVRTHKMTLVE